MDCPFYPPSLEFQAVHPLNPCSLIFRLEPVRNHRRDGAPVPNLAHPRWLTIATNPHAPQAPALKFRGKPTCSNGSWGRKTTLQVRVGNN